MPKWRLFGGNVTYLSAASGTFTLKGRPGYTCGWDMSFQPVTIFFFLLSTKTHLKKKKFTLMNTFFLD